MQTLEWDSSRRELKLIDQRLLPERLEYLTCTSAEAVANAIRDMAVRGAPAIGAAAAFGMALAANSAQTNDRESFSQSLNNAAVLLLNSRPTAVNLAWAVQRMLALTKQSDAEIGTLSERLIQEAVTIAEEDVQTNLRMAQLGAQLIEDGDTIIHHCNTGSLATVDWGTALGVIRMAYQQGKAIRVLVDETRPRLQGARLTAWELEQYDIPYEIITDGAAGYFLRSGKANKVFFGADRVAMNGDVVNKIGTYMLALAAHANQIPVYAVFPVSTLDLQVETGDEIPIEERAPGEVLNIQLDGHKIVPAGASALNPAFDVTPHHLLTAWVTERGIIFPPFEKNISNCLNSPQGGTI